MKKKIISLIISLCVVLLMGCQETPDESAVVSKVDGLDESIIIEPLKEGESQELDIPKHWNATKESTDGKMQIVTDLDISQIMVKNLPVLEMKSHKLSQEELKKLVNYFSEGKKLFVPELSIKEDYQKILERMENGQGAYGNVGDAYNSVMKMRLEEAMELAPEHVGKKQEVEVEFQKKQEDIAWNVAKGRENLSEAENKDICFAADVGEEALSHIAVENYDVDLKNSSYFTWKKGVVVSEERDIQYFKRLNESDESGNEEEQKYVESFREVLNRFQKEMEAETITIEEGMRVVENMMDELEMPEMKLASSERILWFPDNAIPENDSPGSSEDFLWQADLTKTKSGYKYTYTRDTNGLFVVDSGVAFSGIGEVYAPSFLPEMVHVTVTEDGICEFIWEGISDEVEVIAENTRLLSFEKIQDRLFEQISYWYSGKMIPEESSMRFSYVIENIKLGYTYIPAYEKPESAWMVPVWFFTVKEQKNGKDVQVLHWTINALDGGVIGNVLN